MNACFAVKPPRIAAGTRAVAGRSCIRLLAAGDPQVHQQQRETALAAATDWSLAGRVAVSSGKDGGSGRIDWRQQGARYEVSRSAPVTRQSWRLSGEPGQARLEGLSGGPRAGSDPGVLLREATRWEIPVEALSRRTRRGSARPGSHSATMAAWRRSNRVAGGSITATGGHRKAPPRRFPGGSTRCAATPRCD